MLSVLELRLALGLTQAKFARELCASKRSVIYWEAGIHCPDVAHRMQMRVLARRRGLTKRSKGPLTIRYDSKKMQMYLGSPSAAGRHWRTMSLAQRNSWWSHRTRYARIRADLECGRAIAGV
jgi:DNA-binding XRE family transcriptional regulator